MAGQNESAAQSHPPVRKSFWRWARRLLLLLLVLAVFVLTPYIAARWSAAENEVLVYSPGVVAGEPTEELKTLRILAYNIAHGRGPTNGNWDESGQLKRRRIEQIAELIREQNPDVVILNEVDFNATWSGHQNQAEAIARLVGYDHRAEQRNLDLQFIYGSWVFGNAVLSKFPIVSAQPVRYPVLSGWEHALAGSKQGIACTLQLSPEEQVRVIAVHLEVRSAPVRKASAEALLSDLEQAEVPTVLAGDFNSSLSEQEDARWPTGQTALDLLAGSGAIQLPPTKNPRVDDFTFSSTDPQRVIDWILIPPETRYAEYRVLPSELSDHRPVMAVIELPASP